MLYKPYLTSILLLLRPMPLLLSIELSNSGLKKRTPKELHYTLTDNPLAKSDGFSLGWAQSSCKKSSGRARDRLLCFPWLIIDLLEKQERRNCIQVQHRRSRVPCHVFCWVIFCFAYRFRRVVAQWSRALETSCPSERRTGNPSFRGEGLFWRVLGKNLWRWSPRFKNS